MKKYLCIQGGSRGEIDNVYEVDSVDVEKVATETYNDFVTSVERDSEATEDDIEGWKSYVEEFGFFEKYDWGWSLGLGEENGETYIDMTDPKFIEWERNIRTKLNTDEFEWMDVSDEDLYDLLDLFY